MLLEAIFAALAFGFVLGVWEELCNWLRAAFNAVTQALAYIAHAGEIIGKKVAEGLAEIRYNVFYKEENQWIQERTTRRVNESEVPAHIRQKIKYREANITNDMEQELGLEL